MAFPEDPLDLRGELTIDGSRVDVTKHLYSRDPIEITAGMSAQGTGVDPSTCSLTLNNKDGRYSPRNPLSPYFGKLPRNTPLTVSVRGAESYLRLEGNTVSYARTPDTAALDITGDIDIRVEATTDWYATAVRALIGKYQSSGSQRSYMLQLNSGVLTLWWSTNGSLTFFAQQPLPIMPERAAVRATLDVDNGASGFTARIYWAESMDGPWTQIGDALTVAGVTSIYAGSAPLEIAPSGITSAMPMLGRVHRAEVRNGINGTVVASADLRGLAEGTTAWTDSAGRAWTVGALAAVSDREYLFSGEVASWPAKWDASGRDAWVPIEGAGVLRRLGQNRHPVQSTLRRRIPSDPRLIAYWPMEDGEDASAAYSPLTGVQPLAMSGFDFAADDSLGGSAPLPKATSSASLRGTVPRAATVGWQVEFVFFLPTMPVPQTEILRISVAGATMSTVVVSASTSGVRVAAEDAAGDVIAAFLYTDAGAIADFWGKWNRLAIYTVQDGATVRITFRWRDVTTNGSWVARTSFTGTQGTVTAVSGTWGAYTADMVMGHLAVFDVPGQGTLITSPPGSLIFEGADDGYARETALARLARLGAEEAALVDLSWVGEDVTAVSERMGPQRLDTVLNLVKQAAETDGGILFERPDRLGLVYRERASLYNQKPTLTLDYAAGHLAPPLEPVDDDSVLANDVTVQRAGGSEAKVVIEEGPNSVLPSEDGGVGIYEESATLSLANDSQPYQIAGWMAHLGTWDEPRYPTVTVRLHRHPELIPAVLRLRIGDMLRIVNPPIWAGPGPVDLHVIQIKHKPLPRTWEVSFVCVPAGPWRVGVVDDPVLGRADTDGSELNGVVSATATSWSVAVTAGPLWITTALHPTEFPFDVICGGEVATVTGISGTSSPQTFTVTRSVNGIVKPHAAGADVRLAVPTIAAL